MKKDNVLILIHGFKRQGKNEFEYFEKYLKDNNKLSDFKIINFLYYENDNEETLNSKKMKSIILNILEENRNSNVWIVGYSMGGLAGLSLSNDYDNIEKIVAIFPPFKIYLLDWISRSFKNIKLKRNIKKRVGKEKYKKILERSKRTKVIEKHPIKVSLSMVNFRNKLRKDIKKVKNKKIKIYFSNMDEVVWTEKSEKYIQKNFDFKNNVIDIEKVDESHMTSFDKENNVFFDKIIKFVEE